MRPKLSIPTQPLGRTLAVALGLLGLVAVVQLGALTAAFFKGARVPGPETSDAPASQPPLKIDVKKLVADLPPPADPQGLGGDPLSTGGDDRFDGPRPLPGNAGALPTPPPDRPDPESILAKLPPGDAGAPPRPTPVPLSAFTPKVDPRFSEIIEQGKLLRNSGDTAGALVKFRAAGTLDPSNPLPIAEQAFTYEKMSLPEKAAEQWRQILAMGDRAGVYFSAAKAKLDSAVHTTIRETGGTGAPVPPGKVLGLGRPVITDDPNTSSSRKFTMTVPIIARAKETVAVREMKVFVLFYDRVNGKEIVRTSADVSNRWGSPPADWTEGDTETLEVAYELAAQPPRGERREYHGYIVRLYYRGELQDTQADPINLNQKFPAPFTLSE